MAGIRSKIKEEAEGCFTSMIDIVFLLLIFFILQPFKQPDYKMMMFLPKKGPIIDDGHVPPAPLTIRIGGDRNRVNYFVNGRQVNKNYLASRIIKESNGDESIPVEIAVAPTVYFKNVMRTIDECSIANMKNVSFINKF